VLQGFVRAVVVANRGDLGDLALSGAQDSCIKLWDMRAPHGSRCVATLTDHTAEVCFLSVVGDKLFSGSAGVCSIVHTYSRARDSCIHTYLFNARTNDSRALTLH
jgi:WD40 repeat protein